MNNSGLLKIETAGTTSTLDGVAVTNNGVNADIQVDLGGVGQQPPPQTTLKLANGTTVTNGKLTINNAGTLEVSGTQGATLDNVDVSNGNSIVVDAASLLLLEDTSISGTGTVTVSGELDNETGGNTIDGAVNNTGTIDVEAGTTLDLAGGLSGIGIVKIDAGATLDSAARWRKLLRSRAVRARARSSSTALPFPSTARSL